MFLQVEKSLIRARVEKTAQSPDFLLKRTPACIPAEGMERAADAPPAGGLASSRVAAVGAGGFGGRIQAEAVVLLAASGGSGGIVGEQALASVLERGGGEPQDRRR